MNAGDTLYISLDYEIDGQPIEELEPEEIEFSFGKNHYLKSAGDIAIDEESGKYRLFISQDDTLDMFGVAEYQVRFRISGEVVSDVVREIHVGRSLSTEVI